MQNNNIINTSDDMPTETKREIKNSILKAWAKIICNDGFIDHTVYNKMITKIDKLK